MIILPDRHTPRARFLIPVAEHEWRSPSQAQWKDQCGNPGVQTRFRARAKTHDGVIVWVGWFDDRADFDAFLWAIACGSLQYERPLWRLPTPMFPGLDLGLVYDFATVTFLTATTSSTYTKPVDWNNSSNNIQGIGAGGAGAGSSGSANSGAGGAFARQNNVTLSSNPSYRCGAAAGTTGSGTAPTANTFFLDGSTLVAAGGQSASAGVSGGSTANSVGTTKYKGGDGNLGGVIGAGAGGAAGPNGAGGNGQDGNDGTGGAGDAGYGGSGGSGSGAGSGDPGGAGSEFDATHGSGGGGGGGTTGGGAGGNYGAGGGGKTSSGSGGIGKQGLLVVTYEPRRGAAFNMPMLGM